MSELLTGRIALTLAHFLWQGLLIAVFVWLVSAMLRGKSANAR